MLGAYVSPALREQFKSLASTLGLTTQELLTQLAENAVARGVTEAAEVEEIRSQALTKIIGTDRKNPRG